jgi:transposase-like protein
MSQHFLLSPAARTLSLMALCQLSDETAYDLFRHLRWPDSEGAPVCPGCDCQAVYAYRCRRVFKCKACHRQFSVTSRTLFASRKLPFRVLLFAIGLFVNAAKGISSLQASRDLNVHAKTAFVLLHKFRYGLMESTAAITLNGVVEIDGAWFGGHIRPHNHRAERIDRRRRRHQTGKRRCVVVLRQRRGPTVPVVTAREADAVPIIRRRVAPGSVVHADEAAAWDDLHAWYEMRRINHRRAYSMNGECTNQAESYFSRLRRAEIGQHHHIAGPYLEQYSAEMAWREYTRRTSNGAQFTAAAGLAAGHPSSHRWTGYWQRHHKKPQVQAAAQAARSAIPQSTAPCLPVERISIPREAS